MFLFFQLHICQIWENSFDLDNRFLLGKVIVAYSYQDILTGKLNNSLASYTGQGINCVRFSFFSIFLKRNPGVRCRIFIKVLLILELILPFQQFQDSLLCCSCQKLKNKSIKQIPIMCLFCIIFLDGSSEEPGKSLVSILNLILF